MYLQRRSNYFKITSHLFHTHTVPDPPYIWMASFHSCILIQTSVWIKIRRNITNRIHISQHKPPLRGILWVFEVNITLGSAEALIGFSLPKIRYHKDADSTSPRSKPYHDNWRIHEEEYSKQSALPPTPTSGFSNTLHHLLGS